ncbi:MAG TPA: hypothetical protein VFK02_31210 [Kofleriaceae bacterium]|nr:hypothetical protein [Kofleriaceae bacterium]
MLSVQDLENKIAPDQAAPEVAAPEPEPAAAEAQFTSEGAAPEVADGSAVEPGQTASEQAFGDKPTANTGEVGGGMYAPDEYRAACTAAGTPDKWDDKYIHGHTEATQWIQPYEGRYDMAFELQKGQSASQAVKDFIAGPTIADYRVIGVAIEMNELRDELGDQRFDQMFGSSDRNTDAKISGAQRLKITAAMYTIPFAAQMLALAAENEGLDKTEEPEAPAVEARVEEKPEQGGVTAGPAPEMIAEEMGVQREQEFA